MTDPLTYSVEFGKERRPNGWFVLERTVGSSTILEYGPMPEKEIPAFIEQLKAAIRASAQAEVDRQKEHLSALMQPGGFKPKAKDAIAWPPKRKPQ